jgi:hypothetical protein
MSVKKIYRLLLCAIGIVQSMHANFSPDRMGRVDERMLAFNLRINAAGFQTISQPFNDMPSHIDSDETNLPNYVGNFSKLLQHDLCTGVLTAQGVAAYEQMLTALDSEDQADWNAIEFAPGTQRLLVTPQAGFAYSMQGGDSSLYTMPTPPVIASPEAAADLIETYLLALCRDVLFADYGTGQGSDANGSGGSKTIDAASILTALGSAYIGPVNGCGRVDPSVLFRGSTAGDQVGPYISQFLLKPLPILFPSGCEGFVAALIGVKNLPQAILVQNQVRQIPGKREFGVSWDDFVAIQNGLIPKVYAITDYDGGNLRYPIMGRDIGSFVHFDEPYEAYYNALIILASNQFPAQPTSPYRNGAITKEGSGIDMGVPDAFALVGAVSLEAFKASWAQKWRCYRRLRPEAMAGLVHQVKITNTNPYNLDASLFATYGNIDFLQWVRNNNALQATAAYDPQQLLTPEQASTYLLAQMYPEASPVHPSYPSGHATVAGACITVLKAIFDDQYKLINKFAPVKVDPTDPTNLIPLNGEGENDMTVGGELDKLASNIGIARNFSGVHYRWDAEYGMQLGEQVAIRYLQDHARTYPEPNFTGYVLTKRDGTRIQITPMAVTVIG